MCVSILSLLFLKFCIVVVEIQHLLNNEHDGKKTSTRVLNMNCAITAVCTLVSTKIHRPEIF